MSQNAIKRGDIVTVICPIGEFIGEHGGEADGEGVLIIKPRMLVQNEKGIGFAPGICLSGELEPEAVAFYPGGIITIVPTVDSFAESWKEYTCAPSIARV